MNQDKERLEQSFRREDHVLIVTIVEPAFVETALGVAAANGAEGCTIIHGRGKHVGKKESVFSVPLDVSRHLILTIVHKDKAAAVQNDIYEAVGLKTEGHGLVYQLPIISLSGMACACEWTEDKNTNSASPPPYGDKGGNG